MLYAVVAILSASVFFCVYGIASAFEDAWRGIRAARRRRAAR